MWNEWLEKGKTLAASIDKQLNDSVGVEGQGNAASLSAPGADSTNAWNDDDFGDDFDDKLADSSKQKEETTVGSSIPQIIPEDSGNAWDNDDDEVDFDEVGPDPPTQPDPIQRRSLLPPAALSLFSPVLAAAATVIPVPKSTLVKDQNAHEPNHELQPTPELEAALEPEPERESEIHPELSSEKEPEIPCEFESQLKPESEPEPEHGLVSESTPTPEPDTNLEKDTIPEQPTEDTVDWEEDLYVDDDDEDDEVEDEPPALVTPNVEQCTANDTEVGEVLPMTPDTALVNESIGILQKDQQERIAQIDNEHSQRMNQLINAHKVESKAMQSKLEELQAALLQREAQLSNKAEQMATMASMHDREREELQRAIADTKEQAKARLQNAKSRVESMEAQLKAASGVADAAAGQGEIIAALREEGGKLARKQADMEKAVRAAKGEARELMIQLEREKEAHEKALDKIVKIEVELKETRTELASARKGETLASKLEITMADMKEELERKTSANLDLNQQVKELKSKVKELSDEVETATRGALLESKRESNKIIREHGDMLSELEVKLRASEREASVREDALRQEVTELRKRWQDAVRRADSLSMDVQSSTAPLLRQLESMERQSRSRAGTWAELETKLRTDLEDNVIEVEKLTKERNELKANFNRLQRTSKERDEELLKAKTLAEESTSKVEKLETALLVLESESRRREEEYVEVERLANEGVSKVRSDMMKTVVESEERYRAQMESIENELKQEKNRRKQLEEQLQNLLENVGLMAVPLPNSAQSVPSDKPQKKLRASEGQADILASTLASLADDNGDEYESDEDYDFLGGANSDAEGNASGLRSFAAMEELSQRLKASTVELEALRSSLKNSESTRASLVDELSESRQAKEKLPLYEAKVRELTDANREMTLEIQSLQDDINETRFLYRAQLNALLEEKASVQNGHHPKLADNEPDANPTDPVVEEEDV